jgi:hypothetical protein
MPNVRLIAKGFAVNHAPRDPRHINALPLGCKPPLLNNRWHAIDARWRHPVPRPNPLPGDCLGGEQDRCIGFLAAHCGAPA